MLMVFITILWGFTVIYLWLAVICLPGCMVKTAEVIVGLCPPVSLQDEQLYRNLHEEINYLALKLEKQGKTDGKNISSRRKHINKMYTLSLKLCWCAAWNIFHPEMNWRLNLFVLSTALCRWLKVQSHLKNYHENLQLALEVSSFYQQADNTLFAINNMVQFPAGLILLGSEIHILPTCTDAYLLFQRKSMSVSKELDSFGDREIRDIASQIMVGNIFSL